MAASCCNTRACSPEISRGRRKKKLHAITSGKSTGNRATYLSFSCYGRIVGEIRSTDDSVASVDSPRYRRLRTEIAIASEFHSTLHPVPRKISGLNRGAPSLTVAVVPDSATDELVGLEGDFKINITDGKHSYEFSYRLPER